MRSNDDLASAYQRSTRGPTKGAHDAPVRASYVVSSGDTLRAIGVAQRDAVAGFDT